MTGRENVEQRKATSRSLRLLAVLAIVSSGIYATISFLSWRFDVGSSSTQRPIVLVLALFAATFLLHLLAIRSARRAPKGRELLLLILVPAVVFRITLWLSVPIQEIDIYRYLWDGAVSKAGVSPYRFSPRQVREARSRPTVNGDLTRLVALRERTPPLDDILDRVHFAHLPTVYPPVSQWVFAAIAYTTPDRAPVFGRLLVAKAWFIAFDLATLAVVIGLLRVAGRPMSLCIVYAWCPLLLKEVANSGHLDSIAVFLATLSVYLAALVLKRLPTAAHRSQRNASVIPVVLSLGVAVVLALAVGAKLYPVVLAPLLFAVCAVRIGWRWIPLPVLLFSVTVLVVLRPMMAERQPVPTRNDAPTPALANTMPTDGPVTDSDFHPVDPRLGIATFLSRWEMNDFLFLILVENMKPDSLSANEQTPWFCVVPLSVRNNLTGIVSTCFGVSARNAPFLAARVLTLAVFLVLATWFAWQAARTPHGARLAQSAFLTLAWFWLLCPTQNPWYWTWVLPFLPFLPTGRMRVWLFVSGIVFIYYLRFWFSYHWSETHLLGTGYAGTTFFDFVVTWIEFAPWFAWLAMDGYRHARQRVSSEKR